MQLGELEFHVFSAGRVLLDGGAMFGVIPRVLWEKKLSPDARNRVTLAMNTVLIRAAGKTIVVETGVGDMDPKTRDIFGLEDPQLMPGLRRHGVKPEDVDLVVNTHLHFDHCGGNTQLRGEEAIPAFPNARYIAQRGEFRHALHPTERERPTYRSQNFAPLERLGVLDEISGNTTIAPGVECIVVPGHTADMQCLKLTGGGKTAFLFADLVPTTAHLPLPWIASFDLFPLTSLENKKIWISEAGKEEWLVIFAHDSATPAAYLRERDGRWEAEPVRVD